MALAWPDKYTLDLQLFINNSIVVVVVVVVVVLSFVFCFQVIWGGETKQNNGSCLARQIYS